MWSDLSREDYVTRNREVWREQLSFFFLKSTKSERLLQIDETENKSEVVAWQEQFIANKFITNLLPNKEFSHLATLLMKFFRLARVCVW